MTAPDFRDRFGPRILPPGADPKDTLRLYREMSPVNYLKADSPPLLMIQGDKDTTIPVKHAYYMKEKAEAAGAPVEIMIIKNAGHNWREVDAPIEPTIDEIVQRTVRFFSEHLNARDAALALGERARRRCAAAVQLGSCAGVCPRREDVG